MEISSTTDMEICIYPRLHPCNPTSSEGQNFVKPTEEKIPKDKIHLYDDT